jgi:hypothetical protein
MDRIQRVLPGGVVEEFLQRAEKAIRRAYDIDAGRYDESVGDDTVTFGIDNYRHVWFHLEQELADLDPAQVSTARPAGSLAITVGSRRVRVYRGGLNEQIDIHAFDFDEGSSLTKASLASDNQMVLDLAAAAGMPSEDGLDQLVELAIVHAGNPEDGCCAIWMGAPRTPGADNGWSTWAWVEPVWLLERATRQLVLGGERVPAPAVAHTELREPDVPLSLQDDLAQRRQR